MNDHLDSESPHPGGAGDRGRGIVDGRLRQDWPDKERLDQIVLEALRRNQTFEIAARPKKIIAPIYSRYTQGMHYGSHLDNAIMDRERLRIDLSLTLFLSAPDTYDGGELVIETEYGPKSVKLPAGDGIV